MNEKITNALRNVARLTKEDRDRILSATDDDLPSILRDLGISLPSNSWFLRILKVLLYAAGILLAGMGTAEAATIVNIIH